jgi:hypothetical protein
VKTANEMTDIFSIASPFPLPTGTKGHRTAIFFAILSRRIPQSEVWELMQWACWSGLSGKRAERIAIMWGPVASIPCAVECPPGGSGWAGTEAARGAGRAARARPVRWPPRCYSCWPAGCAGGGRRPGGPGRNGCFRFYAELDWDCRVVPQVKRQEITPLARHEPWSRHLRPTRHARPH